MYLKECPWLDASIKELPTALPGALLIHGQRGTGKQHLARSLCQSQLCETPSGAGLPCGHCEGCHLFEVGNHPDFRHLRPAKDEAENATDTANGGATTKKPSSIIGIDSVRELTSLTSVAAHRSGTKVVMITPAEALHPSAANALLKMLEEPGRDTCFILVTNDIKRILPTIRSRCFLLHVKTPSGDIDMDWLQANDPQRAKVALALSSNAPFAARDLIVDENFWAGRESLMARLSDDSTSPVDIAGAAESLEPAVLGRLLNMWVFDLLVLQQGGKVRFNVDIERELVRLSSTVSGPDLCRWSDDVQRFFRSAEHPLNRRLALESLFASWPGSSQRLLKVAP